MRIIGIDPGASGGIGVICFGDSPWPHTEAFPIPATERDLHDVLHSVVFENFEDSFAYIEHVHSMPKQGVKSAFTFGMNYGGLRMCLIALGIPFETVTPAKWQRALGCLSKGDKNVTKRKAQELFPGLKITHKTADSLLIAEYGRRLRTNERTA